METQEKTKLGIDQLLKIQLIVIVYSFVGVLSKTASAILNDHGLFSLPFIGIVAAIFLVLAFYAFWWQKILKKIDLSVAYVNKGLGILWSLLWSILIFQEKMEINHIIGIVVIVAGILVVTRE